MKTNLYETVYVLGEKIEEKEGDEVKKNFENLISQFQGEILRFEFMGEKELAYEIKKNKRGKYYRVIYRVPPEAQKEITRVLRLEERVIRFFTLKIKQLKVEEKIKAGGG